jgi:hypothetical protein
MPNTWDSLRALGTWDYIAQLYATWDDLYNDVRQPAPPPGPIPGPQAGVTPDLAGLSLGGAYQAGLAAGFENFKVVAYRQTWMLDEAYWFREVSPAVGYVAQVVSPGDGPSSPRTASDGSFYTTVATVGVPDQLPDPGDTVATNATLCFVFQIADDRAQPNDIVDSGVDPVTGVMAWWEYSFAASAVPGTLQADMTLYNGPPMTPVDVADAEWPQVAVDPLLIFTAPPPVIPDDLISDVPPFEQESYEITAVLRVVANELGRIAAAQGGATLGNDGKIIVTGLAAQWFPLSADVLLGTFEAMLGLPVDPPDVQLNVRRNLVLAYLRRLRVEGTGLDWIASMNSLAGTAWDYAEHDPANPSSPAAYTLNVNIPEVLARVGWNFVRDITPAHIGINEGYTGGWLVGISDIGIDLL